MQGDGYFLRLGPATSVDEHPAAPADARASKQHHRPRRSRTSVRPFPLIVLLLLLGAVGWASQTPGGVSARVEDGIDWVRDIVEDAATDPGFKRATDYFNRRYENEGSYAVVNESDLRDDPAADWGVGIKVVWCTPNSMVLQSLTGGGTVSRLLVNGATYGEAEGAQQCPVNLADPRPFTPAD
ncbi:MAG TPA: hypothetical protein VFZ83_07230 [Acidimicrobiia bacterium]|nr:hypothetical protein [Acidimicrobiia bacterium]